MKLTGLGGGLPAPILGPSIRPQRLGLCPTWEDAAQTAYTPTPPRRPP